MIPSFVAPVVFSTILEAAGLNKLPALELAISLDFDFKARGSRRPSLSHPFSFAPVTGRPLYAANDDAHPNRDPTRTQEQDLRPGEHRKDISPLLAISTRLT